MGHIMHKTLVLTADMGVIDIFHEKAVEIFKQHEIEYLISPIVSSRRNGYCSFFIAPDGGKEGWESSISGDEALRKYHDFLLLRNECFHFFMASFGDDDVNENPKFYSWR